MTKRTHHRRRHPDVLRRRHGGQHRQDRSASCARRRSRGAQVDPAVGAVPGHLLLRRARIRSGSPPPTRGASTRACSRCRSSPRELGVVIPISFFEKDGPRYYNSVAMADADGDDPRRLSQEPHPRRPRLSGEVLLPPRRHRLQGLGDAGSARIGVGICWDQWYPEARARHGAAGAEVLFYPTAIGSEPHDAALDTHAPWQRAMQGHAVSNVVPVVAANRIGLEENDGAEQKFYGHSFIADHRGEIVESFGATDEGVLVHTFDLDRARALPRRLGLLPRPPHRPLCQEHRLIRPVSALSAASRSSSTAGGCRDRARGAPARTLPSACRKPCRPAPASDASFD